MESFEQVGEIISKNLGPLHRPGVISVRPGYHIDNGWPVGDPLIVVIVTRESGEASAYGLPDQIVGVPIEVREAFPLEVIRSGQPMAYATLQDRIDPEERLPEFPYQFSFNAAGANLMEAPTAATTKQELDYEPAKPTLSEMTDDFTIICSVSPDAGWPTLNEFFGRVKERMTVGIYDFTSAHILEALENSLNAGKNKHRLSLVLDDPKRNPTADQGDPDTKSDLEKTLGDNLSFAWAPVRSSPMVTKWIFPTAYHIKTAVRDGQEMWLSSGNWNNSNQPKNAPFSEKDPARAAATFKKCDRDWHVVISHKRLAQLYEAYLLKDLETAAPAQEALVASPAPSEEIEALAAVSADLVEVNPAAIAKAPVDYFGPEEISGRMTIQPLLTPDIAPDGHSGLYAEMMLKLIANANESLYIQLQYIHPSSKEADAGFSALLDAVTTCATKSVDVRVIVSQWQNSQWMERLRAANFDTSLVRIQQGVHNKGFIVDHAHVVVSSQNWSGQGVLQNRDAGLIISNEKVARYFEKIFLHDWENLAVSHDSMKRASSGMSSSDGVQIYAWEDDPGETMPAVVPPVLRPIPDLTVGPLKIAFQGVAAPSPNTYPSDTSDFRFWAAAEAAARGAAFWRQVVPPSTQWYTGETLNILLDAGADLNAYYDRKALNFFHGSSGGRTVYSGESPDVVCHEQGHAILDALRPELFNAGSIEVASFHEAFGDMSALLAALQLESMRTAILADTGGDLYRSSRLSRLAEQLGWAIRQSSPSSVESDCLRNAANSFFYANPESLPSNAPATALSSEPHSFSRVFTGAFLEALAGAVRLIRNPTEADVARVSLDFGRILVAAVMTAPIVPEYMTQVAAAMVAADASASGITQNLHGDVLRSAFVRHGILSYQSAVEITAFRSAGITSRQVVAEGADHIHGELPIVALAASQYGFGNTPLLVRLPSDPRRMAVSAASFGVGPSTPSNSEHAARAFVEDLLERGHLDLSGAELPTLRITHPHTLKTHRLIPSGEGLLLARILFD